MPKCVLCDSQAFDILDGLYFCIQCGTQSQDICEEEVEDTYVNEPSRPNIRKQIKGKRPKKFKEKDLGKPWFTLEGFQILLKAQIEYLLKIGVDPKLKDVVGQMWFRYIQLSTDVFLPTVHGESKNLDGSQYVRPLKKSRDNIKDFIPTNSIYRPLPKSKEDKQEELDALELSSEIAREDYYEGDDPTGALFDSDSDSDNGDNDNDNVQDSDFSCCGSTAVRFHKTHNGVSYMTLSHTLAFCYLGLLWLKEPICISDLLRWAREGHLPYLNAFSYFPSYMKFSQADTRTFSPHATLYKKKVYTSATVLKSFLHLPDIPKHDIKLYIARYATDLHLPASVLRYINTVVPVVSTHFVKMRHIISYDDLAMAFIILSLKLLYGLNGKTECDLAKLVVQKPQEENCLYFPAWSDVLEVLRTCQKAQVEQGVPWTKEEFSLLKDCRNYSQFCRETIFGSWKPPGTVRRGRKDLCGNKGLNAEKQKEYAKMFDMFLEKDGVGKKPERIDHPSSFPLLCGERDWSANRATTSSCQTHNDPIERAQQRGLSLRTIQNYYRDVDYSSSSSEDISTDRCTEANKRSQRSRNQDISSSHSRSQFVRYDHLNCHLMTTVPIFRMSECWKDAVLPDSLRQLVNLCSKVIGTQPAVLFTVVQELEKGLFEDSGD